ELLHRSGVEAPRQLRVAGGGAVSPLWRQILADALGVPLSPVQTPEAAAFGAGLLAAVGVGAWPDAEAAARATVVVGAPTAPSAERSDEAYARFTRLYTLIAPSFPTA
ncbi:MAG: FGGY-family carbohydrate kinase, partial [Bacteroidota bacterium]